MSHGPTGRQGSKTTVIDAHREQRLRGDMDGKEIGGREDGWQLSGRERWAGVIAYGHAHRLEIMRLTGKGQEDRERPRGCWWSAGRVPMGCRKVLVEEVNMPIM